MKLREEIGSNFAIDTQWFDTLNPPMNIIGGDNVAVLSGRTAIDIIAQQIPHGITWFLPAYCCDSMVFPIEKHHNHILFYDIAWANDQFHANIPNPTMPSVLFLCNFFGCGTGYSTTEIARLKQQGHIIVYDHTHTAFNTDDPILPLADYHFAALRKWLPIASGAILHMPHNTSAPALKPYPHTQLQWQAMQLKQNYLNGQINDKDAFFAYFHQFAEHLLTDYQHYGPDEQSLNYIIHANIKGILKRRKRNATMLREAFKNAPIDIPQSQTDHLFVPVFLPHEVRNSLRKHLTDNNIYCPIHWPQPQQTKPFPEASKIYDSELSIICDQRYDTHAMNRIIQTINNFL